MRFNINSFVLASIFSYAVTVHCGLTAFSGNTCDGAVGNDVPCDGSCHSFDTRHSFRVDASSTTHCVTMFVSPGCPASPPNEQFTFTQQNGQCTNVNTGTAIESFICSPNDVCLV